MRFIQYSRKSSEGDERQVQSIPDQNSALERLIEQQNLTIVKRFEESKSAKMPDSRPLFKLMLNMIKRGEADGILCWHLNRLSRNPVDSGQLSWLLQQGLIQCIKTPEREYLPEDNVVVMAVENAVSNQYILDHRKNVIRAQDEKARRGWWPYSPPLGYQTNRETHQLEKDPIRFPLIRRAWDLMLTGAYTVPQVLDKLTGWGYRSQKKHALGGKPMARSRLYKLFDDPFYYGVFDYKGNRQIGRHEPMVTRDEFQRVQNIIHKGFHIQPKRHTFAFTGLMRCGGCGCLITAERKTKYYKTTDRSAVYVYYRCTRNRPCTEPCVTEMDIYHEIKGWLDQIRLTPAVAAWCEQAILRDLGAQGNWAEATIASHRKELNECQGKIRRLLDMRIAGELSAGEYQEMKETLGKESNIHTLALSRMEHHAERSQATVKNLFAYVVAAAGLFDTDADQVKREIAVKLAEAYVLTKGKLQVKPHPLIKALSTFEPLKSRSQRVHQHMPSSKNPRLWAVVDNIVTLLRETDVAFPQLECLQQVQQNLHSEASEPFLSNPDEPCVA